MPLPFPDGSPSSQQPSADQPHPHHHTRRFRRHKRDRQIPRRRCGGDREGEAGFAEEERTGGGVHVAGQELVACRGSCRDAVAGQGAVQEEGLRQIIAFS